VVSFKIRQDQVGDVAHAGDQHIATEFAIVNGFFYCPMSSYLVTGDGEKIPLEDIHGASVRRAWVRGAIPLFFAGVGLCLAWFAAAEMRDGPRVGVGLVGLSLVAFAACVRWLGATIGALSAAEKRRWLALGAATGLNVDPELLPPREVESMLRRLEERWRRLAPESNWRQQAGYSASIARALVKRGRARSNDQVKLLLHALAVYSHARKLRSRDLAERAKRAERMKRAWAELAPWTPAEAAPSPAGVPARAAA
jgi:hypothetical protein